MLVSDMFLLFLFLQGEERAAKTHSTAADSVAPNEDITLTVST